MQGIIDTMLTYFNDTKLSGSYFALFLLSLFALYFMNKRKNRAQLLYAVLGAALVYANPVTVFILSRVFPVLRDYGPFISFIPVLLLIPYAAVELLALAKEHKKKVVVVILFFLLTAVAGNILGFANTTKLERPDQRITKEQQKVIETVTTNPDMLVLADETIAPYLRAYASDVELLYGKDLWTPGMDLGIMDEYGEEMLQLYEAMKNPEDTMFDISQMAALYDCDYIIVKRFEEYPRVSGNYALKEKTEGYLIYKQKD